MGAETPMSASRVKRFYLVAGGRGYSLAFEAREDVFARVSRWCDLIAETFKVGAERRLCRGRPRCRAESGIREASAIDRRGPGVRWRYEFRSASRRPQRVALRAS